MEILYVHGVNRGRHLSGV